MNFKVDRSAVKQMIRKKNVSLHVVGPEPVVEHGADCLMLT